MELTRVEVQTFRNIMSAKLQPASGLNLIYGDNGSGKTSLLEAIYFLGMGRSFRSHLSQRVITTGQEQLTLFAHLQDNKLQNKIGLRRQRSGHTQVKINGEHIKRLSTLADKLPLQLITPESFSLLFSGPNFRRQFIDWGAFHSNLGFYTAWSNVKKILKQRNQLLRQQSPYSTIEYWDRQLVNYGQIVTQIRRKYVHSLNEQLKGIIELFLPGVAISVSFTQGWDSKTELEQILTQQYGRDLAQGYTLSGPHKADLRLRVANLPAQDALSRGQLKLVVCALRIAQGNVLKHQINKQSIYLVDDLPSELDKQHRQLLLQQLTQTGGQVFVTAIDPKAIVDSLPHTPDGQFQVSSGQVTQIE